MEKHMESTCGLCKRFEKLRNENLGPTQERNMIADLTDAQVARVLELTAQDSRGFCRRFLRPPRGFDVSVEIAKALRASLVAKNDVLLELGALLRP